MNPHLEKCFEGDVCHDISHRISLPFISKINQLNPENPVSTLVMAFFFCQSEKKNHWVNISYGYFVPEDFACHLSVKKVEGGSKPDLFPKNCKIT